MNSVTHRGQVFTKSDETSLGFEWKNGILYELFKVLDLPEASIPPTMVWIPETISNPNQASL